MIRLGFCSPGDNPVSRLIAGFDAPRRFCHVAMVFEQDLVFEAHANFGVRFRQYVPDPKRFTFVPVHVLAGEDETVRRFCELEAGCGYDMAGVLAIGRVPLAKEDPNKWFCSEVACAALKCVGLFKDLTPHLVSPNGLYLACEDARMLPGQDRSAEPGNE